MKIPPYIVPLAAAPAAQLLGYSQVAVLVLIILGTAMMGLSYVLAALKDKTTQAQEKRLREIEAKLESLMASNIRTPF